LHHNVPAVHARSPLSQILKPRHYNKIDNGIDYVIIRRMAGHRHVI